MGGFFFPTMFFSCSTSGMTDSLPLETSRGGSICDFTPIPMERQRANGWSPAQQERFIQALAVMGSVGAAARAVGMGRASAYRLRERAGAESFGRAWDNAIGEGRARMFDYAMERAMNGVTTVRVMRGGAISVSGGPDMKLVNAALREADPPRPA
jgi:hypothetical protein